MFAKITVGAFPPQPPSPLAFSSQSAKDDSPIHNSPAVVLSALMALNNILDYSEAGRGSAAVSQLRGQDQKLTLFI